jgi:lactate dehydrogenase-like 2-hydroxyacid dehydrogenase
MEKWQSEKKWGHAMGTDVGTGLRDGVGKRVGILGYGSIGRQSRSLLSLSFPSYFCISSGIGKQVRR